MKHDEYTQGVLDALNHVGATFPKLVPDQETVEYLGDAFQDALDTFEIEAEAIFNGEGIGVE